MKKAKKIDWKLRFSHVERFISAKLSIQRSNVAQLVIDEINMGNGVALAENLNLTMCVEKCNFLQSIIDKTEEIEAG